MQLYADAVSSGKENECVEKKILKSQLIGKRKSDKIKVDKTPEPTSKKIVLKQSVLAVKSHPQAAPAPVYQLDPVLPSSVRRCSDISAPATATASSPPCCGTPSRMPSTSSAAQ